LLISSVAAQAPTALADQDQLAAGERISENVMSSENPQVALEALSESEREIFDLYNTPDEIETIKVETLQIETQANNYCRTDGVTFGQKALLGNTLYTWWQRVEICGNPGIQIDNVRVLDAGGETKTPTWSYDGNANPPSAYSTGGETWTARSAESFSQVKLNRRTECVTATIIPSGEYSATRNC
jgi:hypothetical protein